MTLVQLRESVTEAPVKAGNRWKVIVAKPGKGSSGTYSADVLKEGASKIIAPGAQAYIGHDDKRDVREMIGVYHEAAHWSEEDQAVVANLTVFKHWQDWFSEVAPHCGMSLYAMGTKDEDDNVTSFEENVYNGADLVSRPGLVGAGISGLAESLYEAALAASAIVDTGNPPGIQEGKDPKKMDPKDLEAIQALTTAVTALVSAQTAQSAEKAQVVVNDAAVKEEVAKITTNLDAVEAARENLLPSQVESLRTKAKDGMDVAPLIEEYKAMVTEARTLVESAGATGFVRGASETSQFGAYRG